MLSCQFLIYSPHLPAFTSYDDVHLSLLGEVELLSFPGGCNLQAQIYHLGREPWKPPGGRTFQTTGVGELRKYRAVLFVCLLSWLFLPFSPFPHVRIFRGEPVKYQTSHFILQICFGTWPQRHALYMVLSHPAFQRTMLKWLQLGFLFPYDDVMINSVSIK